MNGFDDKPGIQIHENDSAKRLDDDEFELLDDRNEVTVGLVREDTLRGEHQEPEAKTGSLKLSPKPPAFRVSKPVAKPPFKPPVTPPIKPPVQPPFKPPVKPPIKPPVQPPVNPPVKPPIKPPVQPPVNPPVKPPVKPPVQPPVNPPVKPPVKPPVQPPVTNPATTGGGRGQISEALQFILANFVAPAAVEIVVDQITGKRTVKHPEGSQQNADGSVTHPDGTTVMPDGSVKHPDGSTTRADGVWVSKTGDTLDNKTGIYTFSTGESVQGVKNSSGEWTFPDGKGAQGDEKGSGGSDTLPEGAQKNSDGSITTADGVTTYENGDSFNDNTGLFTFKDGSTTQGVKGDDGAWGFPEVK